MSAPAKSRTVELNVSGMTCVNCARSVEQTLVSLGASQVFVDFSSGRVRYKAESNLTPSSAVAALKQVGFAAEETQAHHNHGEHSSHSRVKGIFIFCFILTMPLLLSMFIPWPVLHNPWVQFLLSAPVYVIGLRYFGPSAWGSLRSGAANMDVLILIGCTAAFAYSLIGTLLGLGHEYLFFETSSTIITIVLFGNLLEALSISKTSAALRELAQLRPEKALRVLADGVSTEEIPFDDIRIGDVVRVVTGGRIPIDGEIIDGSALVDESVIRGESVPNDRSLGDKIFSGSLIVQGSISFRATAVGEETLLSKIVELIETAQTRRPQVQRIGDQVSAIFVPVVVLLSLLTIAVYGLLTDIPPYDALLRGIAVLVVACPCAMGLATPTAVMVGIGRAAKKGVLFKGGDVLEQLAKAEKVIFDKTGTLTDGKFALQVLESKLDQNEYGPILKELTRHSTHPVSKSLAQSFSNEKTSELTEIREDRGVGISGTDSLGARWQLGGVRTLGPERERHTGDLFLLRDSKVVVSFKISDTPRSGVRELISGLQSLGLATVMLSGDQKVRADSLASSLGISEIYAEQLPQQKVKVIEDARLDRVTVFVGDGINDAPALASANVGVSLSGATDIAVEVARVVLLESKPLRLLDAIRISKNTYRIIKQNLFWAFFYNILAIPLAMAGYLTPMVAALAMTLSDVFVIANSLRLKRA